MEKNKKMFLTRILYGLFVLSTLVIIFIVYKDIGNDISVNFLLGYSFFAFWGQWNIFTESCGVNAND